MPRYRKSPGRIRIETPVTEELQRYLFYELVNTRHWNHDIKHKIAGANRWTFETKQWKISLHPHASPSGFMALVIESEQPRVWIRHGLYFEMGNARLVIEGAAWPVVDPIVLDNQPSKA